MHLQTNILSPSQSPQSISPSHFSGDHIHHNIKYLEQLLDSSLATVAVIQLSGNTLANVLTPRAYDSFKALYALAALDTAASNTRPRESDSSRTHISISVDHGMLFLWAGLAAVSFLVVFFNVHLLCERDATGLF